MVPIGAEGGALVEAAARCGAACGVSRLAEITGLDVLDVPVFQAVRPWSRALSVHQGKGATRAAAKVSALMEAVECCSAEAFAGERRSAAHEDLAPGERALRVDDFAAVRGGLEPDRVLAWTPARRIGCGGRLWAPWSGVSLDFTRPAPSGVERTSNGLAAGFGRDAAVVAALCELLERDAVAEWRAEPTTARARRAVEPQTLDDEAFQLLRQAARPAGVHLTVFMLASVIGWPVAVCLMTEPGAHPLMRAAVYGSACRPGAADALAGAVLEAAQSRATAISAVRDDILPRPAGRDGRGLHLAPPLPPGLRGLDWRVVVEHEAAGAATPERIAERLARAGYRDVAVVDLPCPAREAVAVKAFAPGLGAYGRRRRPAAAAR